MHRTRHIAGFFHVCMTVTCLLLLPATASAGGLGDFFSDDIVNKIKSIPVKDIFQPSEKREDSADPEPSRNNSSPAAAVAETKESEPAETPASPVVAEIKKDKPAKAPASPAVAKEAEGVKAWCYKKPRVRSMHDCECVADRFIVERQADPVAGKDALLSRILTVNKCPNQEGLQENAYKECIVGSGTPGFRTNGYEVEVYCQCVGKQVAKLVSGHKGKLGPSRRSSYSRNALAYCRKAEAYR